VTRIELDDGKYTVVHDSGAGLHALRYGEHWRDMTGDGLVLAMAQEIEDLRRRIVPVQQVSVPDGKVCVPVEVLRLYEFMAASFTPFTSQHEQIAISLRKAKAAMLAAAPAAPAADAGIVDMYRHLQKVTPYRFKKIQDASITDGGDVMYFHKDRFDAALLADMAAHCAAKGVV